MNFQQVIDETFQHGMIDNKFKKSYLFYFHIISQCRIIENNDIETAGVEFKNLKYNLHINKEWFGSLPINQRLGILKHEAFHIIYSHIGRGSELEHHIFNIASDCAINQQIQEDDLCGGITPKSLEESLEVEVPLNKDSETYYQIILENQKEQDESKDSESKEGTHELWEESDNDEASKELQKVKSKQLFDNAIDRSKGDLPQEISKLMEFFETETIVDWRKVFKRITSNKKALKEATIKKQSRRIRQLGFKGTRKSHKFSVVVLLDVSGSMSDDNLICGLNEIKKITKSVSADISIIQIDTNVQQVEDFNPKNISRMGCGGTEMKPGYDYIYDNRIECDCSILITDGWVDDSSNWKIPRGKNIVLTVDREVDGMTNFRLGG